MMPFLMSFITVGVGKLVLPLPAEPPALDETPSSEEHRGYISFPDSLSPLPEPDDVHLSW